MATKRLPLSYFLRNICRFLFNKSTKHPLRLFLRIWNVIRPLFSKLYFWGQLEVKPSLTVDGSEKTAPQGDLDTVGHIESNGDTESKEWVKFSNQSQRESISLADVAYSLYPYQSGGFPAASRSSQNLQASRSAHSNRSANSSCISIGPSLRSRTSVDGNPDEPNPTIFVRSPTMLTPAQDNIDSSNGNIIPGMENGQMFADPYSIELQNTKFEFPPETKLDTASSLRPSSTRSTISRTSSPLAVDTVAVDTLSEAKLNTPWIVPAMPSSSRRYKSKPKIVRTIKEVSLSARKMTYNKPVPPNKWIRHVHLEGARYFSKKSGDMNIWTEADIFNQQNLKNLENDITRIETFIAEKNVFIPPQSDLVIDLDPYGNTFYYFVNHSEQLIFLLDDYEAKNLDAWKEAPGAESECHIRYEIESQYWTFIMLFPHALNVTKPMVQNLRGHVLHAIGDTLTSSTANVPFSLDNLYKLLTLIDHISENVDIHDDGTASVFGRLMFFFSRERFLNFHGEAHSRLERTFSIYGDPIYARKWLVSILSPLLFYAPDFHLRTLQNMWVDEIMCKSVFEDLMKKMINEWQQFILFATVMLNANVAFLAIQSVDNDNSSDPYRSQAQIFSYLSIVASIGSILLGLLLVREFETKDRESVDEIEFVMTRNHSKLGLEILAILFSLPYALLMWGMIAFLAAFASLCFKTSTISTRTIVGSASVMIALLVVLCVYTNWDKRKAAQPHTYAAEQAEWGAQEGDRNMEDSVKEGYLPVWFPKLALIRSLTSSQQTATANSSA